MTGVLYASALVLLLAAALATVVYTRAVAHARRAYLHVVLAGVFVLVAEVIAVLAMSDESTLMQGVLLVANLVGIGAMFALAARFRSQSHGQSSPGGSLYAWYQARRGFVAFGAIVIIAGVGFAVVQAIAENAENAAEDAERAADRAETVSAQSRKLAAANSRLNCGFAKLIRGSPIVRRPEETPEAFTRRIITIRDFAHDVRRLDALLNRFNLADDAKCEVEGLRVRLTPADRAALVPEILDLARRSGDAPIAITPISPPTAGAEGGDAVGPPPGGGGGPPGGDEPPAQQGVLDPIIDPIAPGADCDVTVGDAVLCTEPDQ